MIPEFFSEMPALQQAFWYLAFFASLIFVFQTIRGLKNSSRTGEKH